MTEHHDDEHERNVGDDALEGLLKDFSEEPGTDDDVAGVDTGIELSALEDDDSDESERHDFDAAGLLNVDDATPDDEDEARHDVGTFAFEEGVETSEDTDTPAAESLDWFEADLPPLDGTDAEGPARERPGAELAEVSKEASYAGWADRRYTATSLCADSDGARQVLVFHGRPLLVGSRLAWVTDSGLAETAPALTNAAVTAALTHQGILVAPAGRQLWRLVPGGDLTAVEWPEVRAAQAFHGAPALTSDGGNHCRLVTPASELFESHDCGGSWEPAGLSGVLATAGSAPAYTLAAAGDTLRLWARAKSTEAWKRLPFRLQGAPGAERDVLFAAQDDVVAVFSPAAGLLLSTSGGLDLQTIAGCSDTIGICVATLADGTHSVLALQAPPSSDALFLVEIRETTQSAARVAELPGVPGEEPNVACMSWDPLAQRLLVLGNFGLAAFAPSAPEE